MLSPPLGYTRCLFQCTVACNKSPNLSKPKLLTAAVHLDGSVLTRWEMDASDALPAMLAPGLLK